MYCLVCEPIEKLEKTYDDFDKRLILKENKNEKRNEFYGKT